MGGPLKIAFLIVCATLGLWLFISNIILGSSFILLADYLSRSLIYPLQIPLGLVIAFIGAPIFIYFIAKKGAMFND